jgi:putative Mg2+ transporter-C (MgtC) family protein
VAAALAALVGRERERARKSAGFRTHMLVGIAAALYTTIGQLSVAEIPPATEGLRADPIRAVQAVAIGIGFLGSGVIFVSRQEDQVQGLTTAANLGCRRDRTRGRAGTLLWRGDTPAAAVVRVRIEFDVEDQR